MKRSMNLSAILWDESHLWGIWLFDALMKSGIAFDLIKAEDLKSIERYKVLFVPGGWASNKLKAINEEEKELIKEFVKNGGVYFGICGGAGLATKEGLCLVDVRRKKDRVPSFSGPFLAALSEHPLWKDIKKPKFYLWWPSEFEIEDSEIKVLATFRRALPQAYSSDLPVFDFDGNWEELESLYEIKLNPDKMKNSPLFVEAKVEKGKAFLSLIHFDTPKDKKGIKVFQNLKEYLNLSELTSVKIAQKNKNKLWRDEKKIKIIEEMYRETKNLISFGERNFLFFKRYDFMYQWRRGIRGFEYVNLYFMIKRIKSELNQNNQLFFLITKEELEELLEELKNFIKKAKDLLTKERIALQKAKLTFNYSEDETLSSIRNELFGNKKSYGGLYKNLIEKVDKIIYRILKEKLG
ncbi:MAG: BPL-N domain-containing protein [Thermodesulfobacterium sp.]|nr:BPL-N domain-containing protein [Thermodesulfobacterium sp.]